jgi:ribosomal protein S20
MANIPEELRNSLERILSYSDIDEEKAELFRTGLAVFRRNRNQSALDVEKKRMLEKATVIFFEIYAAVLKKVIKQNNADRLYQMFLQYGFMDETLLRPEQVTALYELPDSDSSERLSVYNMKEWLGQIYKQDEDPSINQFGKDYYDVFREKKKNGEITDRDKAAYENDVDARLDHETANLFKMGQRLCFGRMTGYFPVLYSEMTTGDLSAALVTPQRIQSSLTRLLQIDYSAFHREIVYNNKDRGILKELVMKPVMPIFILVPTFGERAVLWQELTGHVMNSPGRILFPLFTNEDVDTLLAEAVAHFRWELSKTMAGYVFNNSSDGSLYSDYSDYIQFYKKNHELTPEAKEKIKIQLDRCRNNTANMFVADYKTWINYESKGIMRLNKVARSIMFKHCPFSKAIRTQLQRQPLYNPLITKFDHIMAKHDKALTARYTRLLKSGTPLDTNLMQNLLYYRA